MTSTMYSYTILIALLLFTSVFAAPATTFDISTIFPPDKFPTHFNTRQTSMACPTSNECGVVVFASGTYTSFKEGICMPISGNIESIYVGHCYCSLWSGCSGRFGEDEYVDGLWMCQAPRTINTFSKIPNYISCGGLH